MRGTTFPNVFQNVLRLGSRIAAMIVVAAVLICGHVTFAQSPDHGFIDRVHTNDTGEHRYAVYLPEVEPPASGWPVVLFLHGAGERGTDGRKQIGVGLGPVLSRRGETFPAVVVFPQADFAAGPILETWRGSEPGGRLAMAILAEVERDYPIDPERRTVTGWSMGGYGALGLAAAHPEHWSRVLALAGGGEPQWVPALAKLPVWMVHGVDDAVVPVSESRAMATALQELDHQTVLNEVRGAGHGLWRWVYDSDAVLDWLIAASPAEPPVAALSPPAQTEQELTASDAETPFLPALLISGAISLRLGNDALRTLVEGLPEAIGEAGLSGALNSVADQVEFDDRTFDVRFDELTYQGRLHRAILGGRGSDRMRLSFAVRDFVVQIGRIEVSDARDGVVAGPVMVHIGHREPVWLELEVHPVPTLDGGLQLELLRSDFTIPDHNWYVKPPKQVDIRGELFSPDVVRTALVGGVYVRKATIEEQILAAVPDLLDEVERRVDFAPLASLVTALWPLPVYSPRLEVRLEETSADRDGVSLVFGCAVAGLDETLPTSGEVPRVRASSPAASEIPTTGDLRAAVSLDVIDHLSDMLAGSDAVRLYAADIPGRPFQELDDVESVLAATHTVGSAHAVQDVRSQFLLSESFSLRPITTPPPPPTDAAPADGRTVQIAVDVPRLSLKVFQKRDSPGQLEPEEFPSPVDEDWSLCGESDVSIRQPIRLTTQLSPDGPAILRIHWEPDSVVRARADGEDSSDDQAAEPSRLTGLFRQGWARWAENQRETEISLPDVAVGPAMLRLEQLFWSGDCLTAAFRPPATTLVNRSDRPVGYSIRGPHSRWSTEYTLGSHREHVYRIGYPLHVRPGGSPSPTGQPLNLGTYDWSPAADTAGFHWVRRLPLATPDIPATSTTSAMKP